MWDMNTRTIYFKISGDVELGNYELVITLSDGLVTAEYPIIVDIYENNPPYFT